MERTILPSDEVDRWREYHELLPASGPYHDPGYVTYIAGFLEDETDAELFVLDDGDEFVYYPYLIRPVETLPFASELSGVEGHRDIVASWYYGGPLASTGNSTELTSRFAEEFAAHCEETGIVAEFVRFDPNIENHESFPELGPSFDRETVWVDLTRSKDELWDGFERRARNAIRQAQDTDLVVEPTSDPEDYRAFYRIYCNAMEAKGASVQYRFPLEFFTGLLAQQELASLLVARYEGRVVGGSMLVHDEYVAHDYLRASNPDYWDMRVNNLICYEALMHEHRTDREIFDFQGGRPGVFKFKKSFSKERGEFHVAKRIHIPDAYDELVDAAERAGIDTTGGYFPAYRSGKSN